MSKFADLVLEERNPPIWTEIYRTANRACPRVRVDLIGKSDSVVGGESLIAFCKAQE